MNRTALAATVTAISLLAAPAALHATDNNKISVEFNDLQPAAETCRAVFVLRNGLAQPIENLALRVVGFDADQHATLFLSLDVGALPTGKTRVVRFDLGNGLDCAEISRLLLDDVTSCEGGDLTPASCLESIVLSSRAAVPIDY